MSEKTNKRNERITEACQEIGYCCPYAFLMMNSGRGDTHRRVALKVNLSLKTIEFNRKKLREGTLVCQNLNGCQIPEEAK